MSSAHHELPGLRTVAALRLLITALVALSLLVGFAPSAHATAPSGRIEASGKQAGLPDLLHLQLFAGPSYVHLAAFSNRNLLTLDPSAIDVDGIGGRADVEASVRSQLLDEHTGWGHSLGAAAGLRLLLFTLGVRYAWGRYQAFEISTLMLEAGLRPKILFLEPYLRFGFGHAWLASERLDASMSAINGFAGEVGAGLDVRVAPVVSLGVGVDADVLNLSRETRSVSRATSVSLQDGSAVGGQLRIQGHLTLHL